MGYTAILCSGLGLGAAGLVTALGSAVVEGEWQEWAAVNELPPSPGLRWPQNVRWFGAALALAGLILIGGGTASYFQPLAPKHTGDTGRVAQISYPGGAPKNPDLGNRTFPAGQVVGSPPFSESNRFAATR